MSTGFDQGTRPVGACGRLANLVLSSDDADKSVRWTAGERLHHLFEERCDRSGPRGTPVIWPWPAGTRDHLSGAGRPCEPDGPVPAQPGRGAGLAGGTRVRQAAASYIAMLAVLKINAAYVPLDPVFPADRIAYIVGDAGVTRRAHPVPPARTRRRAGGRGGVRGRGAGAGRRPGPVPAERHRAGHPGGGPLLHHLHLRHDRAGPRASRSSTPSICNFVRVAAEVYGVVPERPHVPGHDDRVRLLRRGDLGPARRPARRSCRSGAAAWWARISPTSCAKNASPRCAACPRCWRRSSEDLPDLRFLLVSGEACPQDLVTRWHRPGRRILNAYGPTEATVTATLDHVDPDQPVTIGVPAADLLGRDPRRERPACLPPGSSARSASPASAWPPATSTATTSPTKAFIPDFLGIPDNPSGRIYRTGDLGRINEDGESSSTAASTPR